MSKDSSSSFVANVPFEFVGKVAGARAVAEASHIKCGATAPRHVVSRRVLDCLAISNRWMIASYIN